MDLTCRAPHPAWKRDPRYVGRVHDALLPVRFGGDVQLQFERFFEAADDRPPLRCGFIEVTCSHRDCGAVHLYRLVRAA